VYFRNKPFFEDSEFYYATIVLAILLGLTLFSLSIACLINKCLPKKKRTQRHKKDPEAEASQEKGVRI
jgi:hypothetical protein